MMHHDLAHVEDDILKKRRSPGDSLFLVSLRVLSVLRCRGEVSESRDQMALKVYTISVTTGKV